MSRCWASPRAPPAEPKATMHFHRDLLIIRADGYAHEVFNVTPDDMFVGSPRSPSPSASAGWRSFRCASAPPPRFGKRLAARHDPDQSRTYKSNDLLHRADRLSRRDGGHGQGRRSVVAAHYRAVRPERDIAGPGVRGMDAADPARRILDGIRTPPEMLHIFITNSRLAMRVRRRDRQAGHRRLQVTRDR